MQVFNSQSGDGAPTDHSVDKLISLPVPEKVATLLHYFIS